MSKFLSPEPVVELENSFHNPFKNAVATAKTCYSSKGIIKEWEIQEGFEDLAKSIYTAGHHTTLQHAHFQFTLSNVSRQFIWSFLHSHPFYNSEQVSQRYVEVKPGTYTIPPLEGESVGIYTRTADLQMEAYHRLVEMLSPLVAEHYFKIFVSRGKYPEKYKRPIKKKAQEIARYVLPVATFAYLYHTVSGIVLARYYRLCQQYDAPLEQKIVAQKMIDELLKVDPLYKTILEEPLPLEETPEYEYFDSLTPSLPLLIKRGREGEFINQFDKSLDGKTSKLIDWKINNESVLAQSVREVFGLTYDSLNDEDAIDLVLNPAKNHLLGESLNLTTMSKLTRCLFHPNYTFRKKLSHTADSQDQRHRMTPASRPILSAHLSEQPDYIMPELVKMDEKILRYYQETMDKTWDGINRLRKLGVSDEFAMYLLPNAVSIRFTESADLLNLHHKHVMRLCYNAQDEIWRASLEEAIQISEINPKIGKYLRPPCNQRNWASVKPICPEGERYCGVRVWALEPGEYSRTI
jgi:thymidylate synthase ThyX